MSNVNGNTCLKSEPYKGFIIDTNINEDFQSEYFSIFNPRNRVHVHINKKLAAMKIVDCFYDKRKDKYGRLIRNRAVELEGFKMRF